MKLEILNQRHPAYRAETWSRYSAAYVGGDAFRERCREFLPRNPMEEELHHKTRCDRAHYTNYVGPIIDWFAAKLMSSALEVKADIEAPPFYAEWQEDVDACGTDLVDFMRARFVDACVKGRSFWVVELPDDGGVKPASLADYEERGLGRVTIGAIDREQVLDWETDERGELEWAIVYSSERPRRAPDDKRSTVVERWRIYDREKMLTFEAAHDENKPLQPEQDIPLAAARVHGLGRVPIVGMGFEGNRATHVRVGARHLTLTESQVRGLWPMARLFDVQVAHFRQEAGLEWSIDRTCYAMPVFSVNEDWEPPKMGAGYYLKLGPSEKMDWSAPPTAHLEVAAARVDSRRDELYRVANQLAQGVDNNAAAVGRSGESKRADAAGTDVLLAVFGSISREAIERTYDLVSAARSETIKWSVSGLDRFDEDNVADLVAVANQTQMLQIPSPTFRRSLLTRIARTLLPGLDEPTRQLIQKEIEDGVTAEETLQIHEPVGPRPRRPGAASPEPTDDSERAEP